MSLEELNKGINSMCLLLRKGTFWVFLGSLAPFHSQFDVLNFLLFTVVYVCMWKWMEEATGFVPR